MSDALLSRLATDLPPWPGEGGLIVWSHLETGLQDELEPWRDRLVTIFGAAPYLGRLALRRPALLRGAARHSAQSLLDGICAQTRDTGRTAPDVEALDSGLRQAKADIHLLLALADLGGVWTTQTITAALTRFADIALQAALLGQVRLHALQGRVCPVEDESNPLPGLSLLALGKMGGGELNYSSDIDIIALYDPEKLALPEGQIPAKRLPRLVQSIVASMQNLTADGYVFRTDLRLRPDPGATPVAVSLPAALNYYEALGQTWERAAWIKARHTAGDAAVSDDILTALQPFIWRRTLDYAAVEDIRALAQQIQTVGRRAEVRPAGHDLKLGRGGIREIEFYVQIPQLVFGGREMRVRTPATLDALSALSEVGIVEEPVRAALSADYLQLRDWEHRIQMRQDEATQSLPERDEDRLSIAILSGYSDLAAFDDAVARLLRRVHGHFADQFDASESRASQAGSLVLSGVEPDGDTLRTLAKLGFSRPERIWSQLNAWAGGRIRAVRNERARVLLARLAPVLLDIMAETGEPDAAFARFASFFEKLPYGVQPLSLMVNNPAMAADLISILTLAPRLATSLAQRPDLLDTMMDARFSVPVSQDPPGRLAALLGHEIGAVDGFEARINAARRVVREERLRIGAQILSGDAHVERAGRAFADLADAAITAMVDVARQETERRYGSMPGEVLVLGMGKLGGRELSADSDLDLMLIYEPSQADDANANTWFTRFAQRFISALSAPTEEGVLAEVDMQLRPSGKAGPVAVQLTRFETYYRDEAWTWELMALTRARVVSGPEGLTQRVMSAMDVALARASETRSVRADGYEMRQRLEREKPARSSWDLKARPGGLQDIEFVAQIGLLECGDPGDARPTGTMDMLRRLTEAGHLPEEECARLVDATRLYLSVAQLIRSAHGSGFDPEQASRGFAERLAALAGCASLAELLDVLDAHSRAVRAIFARHLAPH